MRRLSPCLAVLFGACASATDDSGSASKAISLTLLRPTDGETVCGSPLVVETEVENFTLTNETFEDAPSNVGHLHVYLNGQEVAQSDQETVTVAALEETTYQLRVDLALSNHEALSPYVGTTIYITVDNSLCTE